MALTTLDQIVAHLPAAWVGDEAHPIKRSTADAEKGESPSEPPRVLLERRKSPLPSSQVWMAWTLPGSYGASAPIEDLLARWVREDLDLDSLRQDDPQIRYTDSALVPGAKAAVLTVRVLVDDGADPDRVVEVVGRRVGSMWTRAPTEQSCWSA